MLRSSSHHQQQDESHQQQQQHHNIFDFSFEHDSFSSSSSSSSPSIQLSDPSSSLWSNPFQVPCATPESLDQLASTLDLDFLLADPTSGLGSTDPHYPGTSVQQDELSFDLSLGFGSAATQYQSGSGAAQTIGIVEDASSCSPANVSEGGTCSIDLASLGTDQFYSANTPAFSSVSSTTMNIAASPVSMASHPSQDYHPHLQQHRQPFLAPKQQRTSPSSSSSCSPALSNILAIAGKPGNKTSRKRSHGATESANMDLSSNNSAQDSEEERIFEKRRRNTMAARRFRQRKQDHVEDLESQLAKVSKERDDLRLQVAKWEGEVMALRKLLEMKK